MWIFWLFLFSTVISLVNSQVLEKSRSVWVEQGLVKGKIYNIDGRLIQIFRGIPYAEPPLGDLRFRKPMKKSRWHQELAAVEYGPPCLQFMDFHRNDKFGGANMKRESEDCLYLNVFSPHDYEDESKVFPILVWIHGGSFLAGSADTGIDMEVAAKNIVFKGVTLVTINYRLGPLGFINIFDGGQKPEGNLGIWDMVLALQWIQANIKQFNGDPNRVTIMGESAGGAAASILAYTPKTEGLLHQAIIMSGSSMAGWAIHRHGVPSWSVENLVSYLRCEKAISDEDASEIVGEDYGPEQIPKHCNYQEQQITCLTADMTSADQVDCLRKQLNFSSPLFRKALAIELGVSKMVVDGDLVPAAGINLGKFARMPIMTGVAKKEWAHKKSQYYNLHRNMSLTEAEAAESVYRVVENSFHLTTPEKLTNQTLRLVANATFGRYLRDPTNTFETGRVVSKLQEMEADIEFVAPCQREINAYLENNQPVYVYSFDYVPESPIYEEDKKIFSLFGKDPVAVQRKELQGPERKLEAFHGLDHAFIFSRGYSSNFEVRPFTKKDEAMAKLLTNSITNFIKTGKPSTQKFHWPLFSNASEYASLTLPPKLLQGEIHFPNPGFWNNEVVLMSKFIPKDLEGQVDPDADLTTEERAQLAAFTRAWYALWTLSISLVILIWGVMIYFCYRCCRASRAKPFDNIVISR